MTDINLLTGADLAFIGDAYYELQIRNHVLDKGITKLWELHNKCVEYVSRDSQYLIIKTIENELTNEEQNIFKRGRNYNYKNKSVEYVYASGFEAIIGFLYLKQDYERLEYIIRKAIKIIEEPNEKEIK